jgi:uncharacterized membrane-anchored protein
MLPKTDIPTLIKHQWLWRVLVALWVTAILVIGATGPVHDSLSMNRGAHEELAINLMFGLLIAALARRGWINTNRRRLYWAGAIFVAFGWLDWANHGQITKLMLNQ